MPKLAKILRLYSKFWHIMLKNVKILLKTDFYETLGIFRCKKLIFSVKSIIFIKKSKKNCSFFKRYRQNP